jgi:hypothetical protein
LPPQVFHLPHIILLWVVKVTRVFDILLVLAAVFHSLLSFPIKELQCFLIILAFLSQVCNDLLHLWYVGALLAWERFAVESAFLWEVLHLGVHTAVVMGGVFGLDYALWDWLEQAVVWVGVDELGGGYLMVEVLKYLLAVLAGHPRIIILIGDLRLLSLGPERAVTALCFFHLVHFYLFYKDLN